MAAPSNGLVLVVDDEEGIRVLCRVNLELGGFRVIEAANGAEAVELARREKPDLVFLDLMMPVMDGWDALAELRANPDTASTAVVVLTARTSEEDQIRAWGEGILEYLPKPFNPQLLVELATAAMEPLDAEEAAARSQRAIDQLKMIRELRKP